MLAPKTRLPSGHILPSLVDPPTVWNSLAYNKINPFCHPILMAVISPTGRSDGILESCSDANYIVFAARTLTLGGYLPIPNLFCRNLIMRWTVAIEFHVGEYMCLHRYLHCYAAWLAYPVRRGWCLGLAACGNDLMGWFKSHGRNCRLIESRQPLVQWAGARVDQTIIWPGTPSYITTLYRV